MALADSLENADRERAIVRKRTGGIVTRCARDGSIVRERRLEEQPSSKRDLLDGQRIVHGDGDHHVGQPSGQHGRPENTNGPGFS
jgi:hypothetical protein